MKDSNGVRDGREQLGIGEKNGITQNAKLKPGKAEKETMAYLPLFIIDASKYLS